MIKNPRKYDKVQANNVDGMSKLYCLTKYQDNYLIFQKYHY